MYNTICHIYCVKEKGQTLALTITKNNFHKWEDKIEDFIYGSKENIYIKTSFRQLRRICFCSIASSKGSLNSRVSSSCQKKYITLEKWIDKKRPAMNYISMMMLKLLYNKYDVREIEMELAL